MCRCFALRGHHHDAWLRYVPPWQRTSRYSIAPTDSVLCLTAIDHGAYPKFRSLQWGYPLGRLAARSGHVITISAAAMLQRPWSCKMLRDQRCLIPADGFYIWGNDNEHGPGQAHFVHQPDDQPFYFAALWASVGERRFCFILTGPDAPDSTPASTRMPVILHANYHEQWLDPHNRDPYQLDSMLTRGFAPELESYPVGPFINYPGNDGEDCVQPIGPPSPGVTTARTLDRRRAGQASSPPV